MRRVSRHAIPTRIILLLILFLQPLLYAGTEPCPFQRGERWGAVGDSITHGGGWLEYILIYNLCAHPEKAFTLLNLGSGGDAIHLALKRLDWDIIEKKPDVVTLMFGVNDVWHEHTGATQKGDYIKSMREAVDRLQKAGIKVWLIAPPPYDDQARSNTPLDPKRSGMDEYISQLKAFAQEKHIPLIDFYGEMQKIAARQQAFDPHFTLFGKDRVHLKPVGNFVMADIFLRRQNAMAPDKEIGIAAKDGTMEMPRHEDARFEFLGKKENIWSFKLHEASLPFPRSIIPSKAWLLDTAIANSNRHILKISGMERGYYLLKIDGIEVGSFSNFSMEAGINLAILSQAPQVRQAEQVAALVRKWNEIYRKKLRFCVMMEYGELTSHLPDDDVEAAKLLVEAKLAKIQNPIQRIKQKKRFDEYLRYKAEQSKLQAEADALYAEIIKAAQTLPHHFEIIKTKEIPSMRIPNSENLKYLTFPTPFLGDEGYLSVLEPPPAKGENTPRPKAVLYVMPGTSGKSEGKRVLTILENSRVHEKYNLLIVQPRFDVTPWGANHAENPKIQHERHLLEKVIPFVEDTYFNGEKAPRYLLGFSKGGWSVLSLILRNPDVFEKGAAWDTPALLRDEDFGIWGTKDNMGSLEAFHEFHPMLLAAKRPAPFQNKVRIVWGGADLFGKDPGKRYDNPDHTSGFHEIMNQHGIRHYYFPDLNMRHSWSPDWFLPMLEVMFDEK